MVLSTDHSITKIDNIYVWGGALIAVFSLSWPSFAKPDTTLLALSPDYENSSSLIGGVHSLLENAEGSCRDTVSSELFIVITITIIIIISQCLIIHLLLLNNNNNSLIIQPSYHAH